MVLPSKSFSSSTSPDFEKESHILFSPAGFLKLIQSFLMVFPFLLVVDSPLLLGADYFLLFLFIFPYGETFAFQSFFSAKPLPPDPMAWNSKLPLSWFLHVRPRGVPFPFPFSCRTNFFGTCPFSVHPVPQLPRLKRLNLPPLFHELRENSWTGSALFFTNLPCRGRTLWSFDL